MSLFSGTPVTTTESGTSTTSTPPWYTDMLYNNLNWATDLARMPFDPYTGDRVANTTTNERRAWSDVNTNQGNWKPEINTASTGLTAAANNPTASVSNIDAYMNPYTKNVTDQIARLGTRNLTENLLPGVSDAFVRSGTFGGTRMGEFGARALRDTNESILAQQAKALQEGYGQALTAAGSDADRQVGALKSVADVGRARSALGAADVSALTAAGESERNADQRDIDAAMAAHKEATDYPFNSADWLMNQLQGTAKGMPTSTTTTSTGTANNGPSILSQIAGGLAGSAGAWKSIFG